MHPNTFYSNFYSPKKRDEVFVVMSFAAEFDRVWQHIIEPAVRDELKLTPARVDYNTSGESVVHDILDGIAHSRLVLVDITSSPMTDKAGRVWPQRNANVMWELGVAHVVRSPAEVVVIRADNDPSIFDLTQFRAFNYDPDDIFGSRRVIASLARDRIRSAGQAADDYARRCAQALDFPAWNVLAECAEQPEYKPPVIRTMGDAMGGMSRLPAITRLLDMGAIAASFVNLRGDAILAMADQPEEHLMRYRVTPLGRAIYSHVVNTTGFFTPGVQSRLAQLPAASPGRPQEEGR